MKGYVYLIINDNICKGYVGSTIEMERRMRLHKSKGNNCASKEIICNPYTHEILEEFEINDLTELKIVEQKWIDHYKPYLVNKCRAHITEAERNEYIKAQKKAYHIAHREAISGKNRAYRDANGDAILAKKRARRAANPDAFLAKNRAYYAAHSDANNAKKRERRAAKKLLSISTV